MKVIERNPDGSPKVILATPAEMAAAGYPTPPYIMGVYEEKPMPDARDEIREIIDALLLEFRRKVDLLVNIDGIEKTRPVRSLNNGQLRKVAALWYQPQQIDKLTRQLFELARAAHEALHQRAVEAQRNLVRSQWYPVKCYSEQLIASGVERPERIQRVAMFKVARAKEPQPV